MPLIEKITIAATTTTPAGDEITTAVITAPFILFVFVVIIAITAIYFFIPKK